MFISVLDAAKRDGRRHLTLGAGFMGFLAAMLEVGAITLVSTVTGVIWHQMAYGLPGDIRSFMDVGVVTGLLYVLPFLLAMEYRIDNFLAGRRTIAQIFNFWTYAFFALAALAFLTKTTGTASRGGLAMFFVLGGATVIATDAILRRLFRLALTHRIARSRKLLVIGRPGPLSAFVDHHTLEETGVEIAATVSLPETGTAASPTLLDHRIDWGLEMARSAAINDVLILLDEEEKADLGPVIADRFMDLPVAVHLGQLAIASLYPGAHVSRIGRTKTLALRSTPLNPYQVAL